MRPAPLLNRLFLFLRHKQAVRMIHPAVLFVLVSVVLVPNLPSRAHWLMGWDNLNPELDLFLNIKRALFAVWQEYQGVGLVGGMGHAADLPRLLLLLPFSILLPVNLLRTIWVAAMLYLGVLGTYGLLERIVLPKIFPNAATPNRRFWAMMGGVFALGNLATLQMFHTPFEPFVTHFGFLPWLVWSALLILDNPTKKRLIVFAVISLLSAPQGYVQTVYIAYLILLSALSVAHLLNDPTKAMVKRAVLLWIITLSMNAFWIIPTGYFITTHSGVTTNAKINQMSTDELYERNRAFGTIADTVLLRSFWLDTFDLDPQKNQIVPIFGFWRAYSMHPIVSGAMVFLVIPVFLGAYTLARKKEIRMSWIVLVWFTGMTLLTIATPPFSWINDLLEHLPFFHQAFRIRFTKISLVTGFSYSILFSVGCLWLSTMIRRRKEKFMIGLLAFCFGVVLFPAVAGELFYPVINVRFPKEYTDVMQLFKIRPPGRIAVLPEPSYWGWKSYRWGYTGWGFLWYGTEQPILDRAFDPWSQYNENYYWELSRALYAKDAKGVAAVFAKYDVRYVLLDENIVSPANNRALFIEEIKEMLGEVRDIKEIWGERKLTLYEVTATRSNQFVTLAGPLPTVSPTYEWTDNDVAYKDIGDYIATNESADIAYPYRSLFTKRSTEERELDLAPFATPSALIFDASVSGELRPEHVVPCGLATGGAASAKVVDEFLRFKSLNQRNCLSFGAPKLSHKDSYLVAVESRHISGRPLLLAFINETAKHVELETYLSTSKEWQTDYFVLPPLAPDGLGYSVYLSNDSIGKHETINDIKSVRFYTIPYNNLINLKEGKEGTEGIEEIDGIKRVDHPNPAFYKITLDSQNPATLILSQSYHDGWKAFEVGKTLRQINNHVLVSNWANGWILDGGETTIILFFLPQILQWIGFGFLPIPFLFLLHKKPFSSILEA